MGEQKVGRVRPCLGIAALTLLSLMSSALAQSRSHAIPATTLQWADPGAIEKAKKETSKQEINTSSSPSPTSSASSGSTTGQTAASPAQKPATGVQSTLISGDRKIDKFVDQPSLHKLPHQTRMLEAVTPHGKSAETFSGAASGRRLAGWGGYAHTASKSRSHTGKKPTLAAGRSGTKLRKTDSAPGMTDIASPSAAVDEFDPLYGYSNTISVGY